MNSRVDHDLLADYVGGALDGTSEHERVANLIAISPEWGRAADELAGALSRVSNDLNVLRDRPEPMPEDVAARIEGLFDGARRDPLAARVVTRHGPKKLRRWKRWAAPVAIVAAALGFFAVGWVPSLVSPTARDNAEEHPLSAGAPAAGQASPFPTAVTWRTYDRATLQSAPPTVGENLTTADSSGGSRSTYKAEAAPPLQRLTDPAALQQCLNAVTSALPGRVDFVEFAFFESSPALVISITSVNGQWRFVAGPDCGQSGPDERFRTPLK